MSFKNRNNSDRTHPRWRKGFNKLFLYAMAPCLLALTACQSSPDPQNPSTALPLKTKTISTQTHDGVTIFGEAYFGGLRADAPLILLFHQGGSNGRGEYASIASWLNTEGFRVIAWDQRSGGSTYGHQNRTAENLPSETPAGYCDAYSNLQGAHDYVVKNKLSENVIVWGSSYSGALVFQLAAKNPDTVSGVIAFSPAAGPPLANCRARLWVSQVSSPIFVLKPDSEMLRKSSVEQRDILIAAGVEFKVIKNSLHGSSMLVDERTEHDMSAARKSVLDWLESTTP